MREPMRKVSFKNMPKNFPKITEKVIITKREGNNLGIDAQVKSFGKTLIQEKKYE